MLPIILSALLTGCERRPIGSQEERSPILVKVNGTTLTKREFDSVLPEDYQGVLTSEERWQYVDRWIITQLLYDEVMKSGIDVSEEVEMRLEQYKRDLVADQLVQRVIAQGASVSEDEVREYYDRHAREYITELRVSHILVNTREEAEKVKGLIGQRSFTYLARKYSIDKHSGSGGDLGYLSKGNMIPEFENIVFDMKVGEVSNVIPSEFGYHIIRIADIRDARIKMEFEDVRDEIANAMMLQKRQTVYDSLLTELRARANIEIMDAATRFVGPQSRDTLKEIRTP